MIIHRVRTKGLNPGPTLPGRPLEVDLDLDALGSGIIGVVGPSNAGKTSLLSAMLPLPAYRVDPYYGDTLVDHLPGGGEIQTILSAGGHLLDLTVKRTPKGDRPSAWLRIDASPAIGPNVGPVDAELAKYLPGRVLAMATQFCAQGGRDDIWQLDVDKRRDLFLELLMLDRYERWLTAAETRRLDYQRTAETLSAEIQGLSLNGTYSAAREAQLPSLIQMGTEALPGAHAAAKQAAETLRQLDLELAGLQAKITGGRERRTLLTKKLTELRQQWTDRPALEQPIEIYRELAGDVTSQTEKVQALGTEVATHATETAKREAESAKLKEKEATEKVLQKRAKEELARIAAAAERTRQSMGGVDLTHPMCTACPLTKDARSDLDQHPAVKADAEARLAAHTEAAREAVRDYRDLDESIAARLLDHKVLTSALGIARESLKQCNEAAAILVALQGTEGLEDRIDEVQCELTLLWDTIGEWEEASQALVAAREAGVRSADATAAAVQTAEAGLAALEAELKELQRTREAHAKAAARHEEIGPQLAEAKTERQRYVLLSEFIGELRDFRLNAACPTIEAEANALLGQFWDGRWSITLETTSYTKGGKAKPDFVPTLWDGPRRAVKGCGGEAAVAKEALCLAVAACNASVGGIEIGTLFRDESARDLDRETAVAYMAMLRGFMADARHPIHQLYLISHAQIVQEQCDRIIYLSEGRIQDIR